MQKNRTSALVESLEGRQLFTIVSGGFDVITNGTTISVKGTSLNDSIKISYNSQASNHTLTLSNSSIGTPYTQTISGSSYYSYKVDGAAGDDTLTIDKLRSYPTSLTSTQSGSFEHVTVVARPLDPGFTPSNEVNANDLNSSYLITNHKRVKVVNSAVDTWVFGDSFAEKFKYDFDTGEPVWSADGWENHSINLGVSGEKTQNMLWRINQSGYFNDIGTQPDRIVIMAGTNNVDPGNSPLPNSGTDQQIADGVIAVINALRAKLALPGNFPTTYNNTKFVIFGLTSWNALGINARASEINYKLQQAANSRSSYVRFATIYDQVTPNGNIGHINQYYDDAVHLSQSGYQLLSTEVLEKINSF